MRVLCYYAGDFCARGTEIVFLFMEIAHASEGGIEIELAPPVLGHVFEVPITSTMLTAWLAMFILIVIAVSMKRKLALIPKKGQVLLELIVGGVYDYMTTVLESRDLAKRFYPLVMTIFLFILTMNWLSLLPGVDSIGIYKEVHGSEKLVPFFLPANADLNLTIAIAIISFISIEVAGVLIIGLFKYAGKFINFASPLAFLIGIIELFSELARLISFSFRLFGNIFAGKTLILIAIFFVPFLLPVPLMAFELFVGFIQAFIFAVLTLFFIKLAIEDPHAH